MFYATHWALGDAEQYFLDAVKLRTELYGRQSVETVQTLHDMGLFYLKCCQWEKSITVFEDIVSGRRALSGQNDLSVAECVSVLARLYAHIGLFSYANECLAEMKRIRAECIFELTDKETCDSHLSSGIVLRAQGDLQGCSLEFGLAVRWEHMTRLPAASIVSRLRCNCTAHHQHHLSIHKHVISQVCKAAEYAHSQKMERGDATIKDTTPDMCNTMLHYALSLALIGNFDQSECAFEKLTRTHTARHSATL
jgi:hypothetical protein